MMNMMMTMNMTTTTMMKKIIKRKASIFKIEAFFNSSK